MMAEDKMAYHNGSILDIDILTRPGLCVIMPNSGWDDTNRVSMTYGKFYLAYEGQSQNCEMVYYLLSHNNFERKGTKEISVNADVRFNKYEIIKWILKEDAKGYLCFYPIIKYNRNDCIVTLRNGELIGILSGDDRETVTHTTDKRTFMNRVGHLAQYNNSWQQIYFVLLNPKIDCIPRQTANNSTYGFKSDVMPNQRNILSDFQGPILNLAPYSQLENIVSNEEINVLRNHPRIKKHHVSINIGMNEDYLLL